MEIENEGSGLGRTVPTVPGPTGPATPRPTRPGPDPAQHRPARGYARVLDSTGLLKLSDVLSGRLGPGPLADEANPKRKRRWHVFFLEDSDMDLLTPTEPSLAPEKGSSRILTRRVQHLLTVKVPTSPKPLPPKLQNSTKTHEDNQATMGKMTTMKNHFENKIDSNAARADKKTDSKLEKHTQYIAKNIANVSNDMGELRKRFEAFENSRTRTDDSPSPAAADGPSRAVAGTLASSRTSLKFIMYCPGTRTYHKGLKQDGALWEATVEQSKQD